MKHTPTPWVAQERHIVSAEATTIAEAFDGALVSAAKAHANAALIVRAVNAHESLVSALVQAESTLLMARAELPAETLGQKRDREQIDCAVIAARAALALAKGK